MQFEYGILTGCKSSPARNVLDWLTTAKVNSVPSNFRGLPWSKTARRAMSQQVSQESEFLSQGIHAITTTELAARDLAFYPEEFL